MTDKQIDKIKLKIKKQREALVAEKRKYGGFHDGGGRRYYIADLYLQIHDYNGAITYKKWYDKNFPDDIGDAMVSFNWSVAYHGLNMIKEAEIYAIDTAFKNIYLHNLLLNKPVDKIEINKDDFVMLNNKVLEEFKNIVSTTYLSWLSDFIETNNYKEPINKYISLNKLLANENNLKNRSKLLDSIDELMKKNVSKIK